MAPRRVDVPALVAGASAGDPRSVARLISLVEDGHPARREVAVALAPYGGRASVVGLTGPPGVGKSTTTNALVRALRAQRCTVGVLAVDPSSPFSGGALLGDRIRMEEHATDPGVILRSMASRGHLGGLAAAAPMAVRVLDAAGCDVVLVETVGVGQSEVEVAGLADTTLVLLAPGAGDGVQAAKAGLLEVGDVLVVNKSDRPGAAATSRDLRHLVAHAHREPGAWTPPVVRAVASRAQGVDDVLAAVEAHRSWLAQGGRLRERRVRRAAAQVEALAVAALRERIGDVRSGADLAALAAAVVDGRTDPFVAADAVVAGLAPTQRPRS